MNCLNALLAFLSLNQGTPPILGWVMMTKQNTPNVFLWTEYRDYENNKKHIHYFSIGVTKPSDSNVPMKQTGKCLYGKKEYPIFEYER